MASLRERCAALRLGGEALESFCDRWKLAELSVFGSILREDFGADSDVDILIRFLPNADRVVFDLVYMKEELEEMLGREVDLVVENALRNPFRRASILQSKRPIYAA
ncbi:nucleotidyltransferase family protein [Planctomycetota bacterium]